MSKKDYQVKRQDEVSVISDAVLTLSKPEEARIEWPLPRGVFRFFLVVGLGIIGVFLVRFVYLNVMKGTEYQTQALKNSIRSTVIPAPRGIIKDSFGESLVNNIPTLELILLPKDLPTEDADKERLQARLRDLGVSGEEITRAFEEVAQAGAQSVFIAQNISQEQALVFLEKQAEFPGVSLFKTTARKYKDGPLFSHIIGYEGKIQAEELEVYPEYNLIDSLGKQGIEKSYEAELRGQYGYVQGEVNARGEVEQDLGVVQPVPGNDVILNVDAELQKRVTNALYEQLEKAGVKRAAAVAIDPRNGAVRALVSLPSFDNNLFIGGISSEEYQKLINNPDRPLFNRAIGGEYPPGSTIKPVHAVAALAEHVIDPETEIESRGGLQIGSFFFGDWKAHGFTDMRRAIAVSSDVYFYTVGGGYGNIGGLGIARMKAWDERFGYGAKSGIDLPAEASGFLPDEAWKRARFDERWYIGDDYNSSIGQGYVLATALQIVNSIATIANGGTLYVPRVVEKIVSPEGQETIKKPAVIRENFVDPEFLLVAREGMRETVTEGTAQPLKELSVEVAGKTGTAQFGSQEKTQGWFVSFAPYASPELALVVLVEGQDKTETYNGVPVTKAVYEWYFSEEQVKRRQEQKSAQ